MGDSRDAVCQGVVDDTRRLGGGVVLLHKVAGNVHQGRHVIVDVVQLQTDLGHFMLHVKLMHRRCKHHDVT